MRFSILGISFVVLISAVSLLAQSANTDFEKGLEFEKSGKYEHAVERFKAALKSSGKDKVLKSRVYYRIGISFHQLAKFKEAKKAFSKAVKLRKGKYADALYSAGLTENELGMPQKAELNFRRALKVNKKHAEAWFELGKVLLKRKMPGNAKIAFEKSIEHKTHRLAEARKKLGEITARL